MPEKEANDMVAILLSNQIDCEKVAGTEGTWDINVAPQQFTEAVGLLNEVGYPRDTFKTIGDVFKKSGLVSSPFEERVRFMHALSDNLAETLTHIHGVVTARVHIVLPDTEAYDTKVTPSSAAIFISHLPQVNLEDSVRDIRQLVTNSVEGLSYDKVNVSLFPASNPNERLPNEFLKKTKQFTQVLFIKVANDSVVKFWCLIVCIITGLSAIFIGALFVLFNNNKNAKSTPTPEA